MVFIERAELLGSTRNRTPKGSLFACATLVPRKCDTLVWCLVLSLLSLSFPARLSFSAAAFDALCVEKCPVVRGIGQTSGCCSVVRGIGPACVSLVPQSVAQTCGTDHFHSLSQLELIRKKGGGGGFGEWIGSDSPSGFIVSASVCLMVQGYGPECAPWFRVMGQSVPGT